MIDNKKTGRKGFFWLLAMVLALLLGMGWWAANRRAESLDASMRERLLRQTVAIADTLNPDLVRKLTFTAADKGTPAFECIREQMIAIGKTFPQRGIWSEFLRDGKLFFGPETYPENDAIASQPGTEYQLPPLANLQVFKDKRPVTIGPYTDEYGTFVSTLAPVLDPHTGEVLMLVAVDIIAGDWQSKLNVARISPLLAALALILLFVAGTLAIRWRNRRERYEAFKFRKWIVAPTALALLGGLLIYALFELWELDNEFRQDMLSNMEQARSAYNQIITADVALLRMQIEHIAGEPTLLKAWRQRDRSALTALAQPVFEQLKREYGITHYYLIAPDRNCFLRAHEPGRHGDRIDRHTLLMAEKTGEDAWGAELGPLGAFTLRYVKPWKQDGVVIGYLELGVEIDNVGAKLAKGMDLDVLTLIRKEYTSREKFESGSRVFGFSGQWDAYPDFVVAHQTIPLLPAELSHWLEQHYGRSAEPDMANIRLGKKQFACNVIHLFDAASRNVSDLILLRDVSAEFDAARNSLIFGLTLTALLFGGILILLWSVAGAAERRLSTTVRKLRVSEVRLEQLAEHGRIIAWEVDEQGLYSYVSPVAEAVVGYCPEELVGRMHFYDLHPESGREAFRKAAFAVFAQKGAFRNMENAIQAKGGRQVWISTNGFPLLKTDGTLRGYRGSDTDITERKQVETALHNARRDMENVLVASSQVAIIATDCNGLITIFNTGAERMLGYTAEEMVGYQTPVIFHLVAEIIAHGKKLSAEFGVPVDGFEVFVARARRGGYEEREWTYVRKDGSHLTVNLTVTAVRDSDNQITGLLGVALDITERKRAELYREIGREVLQILNEPWDLQVSIQHIIAALKTRTGFDAAGIRLQAGEDFPYFAQEGFSRNFLLTENTLLEHAPDGGVCRDKDGNVNLECTCGLVISGKTDPALPIFTRGGSFWTGDSLPLLDLPAEQDPRLHPRNQCIHDGYASVALIPIRNKDRIVGLLHLNDRRKGCFTLETVELLEGIAAHIGAALMRKQSEEMLRETNRQLEAATARAVQANTAKSDFPANMSHEIRTPGNG
jgi:PAS domain S-box-containing protein